MTDFALSPEQITAARQDWVRLGHDPAAFDAALTATPAATPAAAADLDTPAAIVEAARAAEVSQARELVAGLRASGVEEDRIRAALQADGYDADALLAVAPDDRSDDLKALDAAGVTPGRAEQYSIRWVDRMPEGMDVAGLAAADQQWRGFLAAIEAPSLSGGSVAEEMIDAGQAYGRLSEPAQALYKMEQRALFNRLSGGEEQAAARLAVVSAMLAKAEPGFLAALRESGALHSATVVSYLAEIGRLSGVRAAVQGGKSLGRATA